MKRKFKILFSTLILTMTLLLSIVSIRTFVPSSNGDDNVEVAAPTPGANQIGVEFMVYDSRYNELGVYIDYLIGGIPTSGFGANKKYDHDTGRYAWNSAEDFPSPDPSKSCAEYFGIDYPFVESGKVGTCTQISNLYGSLEKTEFAEGDAITIVVLAKFSSTLVHTFNIGITDLSPYLDGLANDTTICGCQSMDNAFGKIEGGIITVGGGSGDTAKYDFSGGVIAGTITGTIKAGFTSFNIDIVNDSESTVLVNANGSYQGKNGPNITSILLGSPFPVGAAVPNATTTCDVEYDGSSVPAGSSTDYKLELDPSKAGTTINLDFIGLDKANIVRVGSGANASAASGALAAVSKTNTYSHSLTAGATGESKFVAFEVESEDTNNHQTYVVEVVVKKNTKDTLDSIAVSTSSTTSLTPTLSPAFSAGQPSYTIDVADDVTSLDITAGFVNNQKVKVNGNTVTNGVAENIDLSTTSTITITVESEANSAPTKTYTITVKKLSTDTSLKDSANNPEWLEVVAGGDTYIPTNSPSDIGPWTYDDIPYKSTSGAVNSSFKVKLSDPTVLNNVTIALFDNATGASKGTLNSSGESSSISFGSGASTIVLKVVITPKAGAAYQYQNTLTVTRLNGDTTSTIDTTTFYVKNANTGDTLTGSWSGTTYNATAPDFKDVLPSNPNNKLQPSFNFYAELDSALATAKSGTSASSLSDNFNTTTNISSTYSFNGIASVLTIYFEVYSEVYSGGSTGSTQYIIKITRPTPSNDTSISNVKITDQSSNDYTLASGGLELTSNTYKVKTELPYATTSAIKVYVEYPTSASKVEISTDGTTWTPYDNTALQFYSTNASYADISVQIRVIAEDGNTKNTYTFKAELRTPDDNKAVTMTATLSNGNTYTFTQGTNTFENTSDKLPYGTTESLTFDLIVASTTTSVTYSSTVVVGTGQIGPCSPTMNHTVTIKTEANPSGYTYTIKIHFEAANDNHGLGYQSILVDMDGNSVPMNLISSSNTYESVSTYPYPTTEVVKFKVTPATTVPYNKVLDGSGTDITDQFVTIPYSGSSTTYTFYIQTQASTHTYTLKIKTDAPSSDVSLNVVVYGENTPTTPVIPSISGTDYSCSIRKSVSGEKFKVDLTVHSTSQVFVSTTNVINPSDPYSNTTLYNIGTPLYVKVVAQNTSSQVYTIKTTFVDESDDGLKSFTIDGVSVYSYINNSSVFMVPYSTTQVTAVAEANSQFCTVSDNNGTDIHIGTKVIPLNPGDETDAFFTATAPGSTTPKSYKVKIIRDADTTVDDIKVFDVDMVDQINYSMNDLTGTVPYSTTQVTLDYTLAAEADGSDSALKVYVNGSLYVEGTPISLSVGSNPITFVVEPTITSNARTISINITRDPGSQVNTIATYTTEDGVVYNNFEYENSFSYRLDRNATTFDPVIVLSDPTYSTYTISQGNRTLAPGKNQFTIVVTAQDGSTNPYNITVYCADNNSNVLDIEIVDSNTYGTNVLDAIDSHAFTLNKAASLQAVLNVNNTVSKVYIKVTFESEYSKVVINNSKYGLSTTSSVGYPVYYFEATLVDNMNDFEVYIESEYASLIASQPGYNSEISTKYKIKVNRLLADGDATLQSLVVKDASGNVLSFTAPFNPLTDTYYITNVGNITSVTIEAVPTKSTTSVNIQGVNVTSPNYSTVVSLPALGDTGSATNYIFDRYINTTAEDGTPMAYKVVISRDEISLDSDTEVLYYKIYDEFNVEHFGQSDFVVTVDEYEVTIPHGINSITIEGFKANSYSPVTFQGTGLFTILPAWLGTTVPFTVNSVAADGTLGDVYTFKITFEAPSEDNTLADLKVDGVSITGFDPEIKEYNYGKVPNSKATVDITAILNDPTATIVNLSDLDDYALNEGPNTIVVTVKSQSGLFTYYKIQIERESKDAVLVDLIVADSVLRDANLNVVTFDKAVKDYYAIVPYEIASTSITVKVPSTTYITSCNSMTFNSGEFRTFDNLGLNVGPTIFTINAISAEGSSVNYTVTIIRRNPASSDTSVEKIEIDCFDKNNKLIPVQDLTLGDDYNNSVPVYNYKVPNKVTSVKIDLIPTVTGDVTTGSTGSTYEVYNANNLKVGNNTVVVVVTAEDGVTTKHIVVNIEREKMNYSVNKEAYDEYKLTANEDGTFTLDLGSDVASVVEDYTKYIVTDPNDNLTVEVLSDVENAKCNEVVLKITDGDQTEYVKVLVETTSTDPGYKFDPLWIFFLICFILFIIILICVNRDKYGSINKSRKRIKE